MMIKIDSRVTFTLIRVLFVFVLGVARANSDAVDLKGTRWEAVAARHGLDPLVLYAVALLESRRAAGPNAFSPWPWTIRSPEGPRFYADKATAAADLSVLAARYRNIDVGLMQVNLRWHGERVPAPDALLDARTNLAVAADILAEAIRSVPGDPALGIGRYHQWRDERVARSYGRRVLALVAALRDAARP
jgi:hypothetical protein